MISVGKDIFIFLEYLNIHEFMLTTSFENRVYSAILIYNLLRFNIVQSSKFQIIIIDKIDRLFFVIREVSSTVTLGVILYLDL